MTKNSVTPSIVHKCYPKRAAWSHKGHFGRLLVIGGSERFTGSPIFNALAAYRAGCDLVAIIAPRRAADAASHYQPDLIAFPLEGPRLEKKHVPIVLGYVNEFKPTAVVIGSGLWRDKETRDAVVELVKRIDLPMVLDADGIRAICGHEHLLKGKKIVLTPHANEFQQLTGVALGDELDDRPRLVKKHAGILKSVLLLKGHVDVISDGERVALNETGSAFMTKGGFGDTLSGICGALLARGVEPFEAACAAAWLNGTAGELAADILGEGVLASDLLNFIPAAVKKASR